MKMNQEKRNFIWNSLAGVVNAAEAVVLCAVVTRTTGLDDAGILTIAFSIGNLLMCIGKYGVYNYQVTDIEDEFSFHEYLRNRILTVLLMLITVLIYLGYAVRFLDYSRYKGMVVFLICAVYMLESMQDVFGAYYQKKGRLDIGAKLFVGWWALIFVCFISTICLLKNMEVSLWCVFGISVMVFILNAGVIFKGFYLKAEGTQLRCFTKGIGLHNMKLFPIAFPIFAMNFLSFYVINAPKYAIDACLDDSVQACYGFVSMPVFVIGLLNSFIYHPTLVDMAEDWHAGNMAKLKRRIGRQLGILGGLTFICVSGAALIGIPVLSWLYHTDLEAYYFELVILQLAGGLLGISGYLSVVITVMRNQKDLLWGYLGISVIAFFSMNPVVRAFKTKGVAVEYTVLMGILCIVYAVMLIHRWKLHFKENRKFVKST